MAKSKQNAFTNGEMGTKCIRMDEHNEIEKHFELATVSVEYTLLLTLRYLMFNRICNCITIESQLVQSESINEKFQT